MRTSSADGRRFLFAIRMASDCSAVMMAGILFTIRRFEACAASARILASGKGQAAAGPPEAPTEACPRWSRWGARTLSGFCACWHG